MSWRAAISKLRGLLRGLLGQATPTDDLDEEIRAHLKIEEQENFEAGMSRADAQRAAVRRFGNVTIAQERSREAWQWNAAETLFKDIRFGIRQFRRNPGFTAVTVVTLALGIGATTAIFSVVHSVLLEPLPFKDPGRLIQFFETEESPGTFPLSGPDYLDWQAQNRTLEATSLYSWTNIMSASGATEPESATVVKTQANLFETLGVTPLHGRTFAAGEDAAGKNRIAILSYGFWQRHFAGSANILGKTVVLNNESYAVVGVMPRWFNFQNAADIWTPLDMSQKELGPRGNHGWFAIGRIRTGVTLAQAREELLAISKRMEKQYPDSNDKVHAVLTPLNETLTGDSKTPLLMLMGAVTLVLLVACVNVANLQLARASARQREMAVRASLGAGRWRLVRQMLTESILLSLAGAALGVSGAWWCVRLLAAASTIRIPRSNPIEVDGAVLLFAVAVSVLAGVLFGLAPALQSSGFGINEGLKAEAQAVGSGTPAQRALRDSLVLGEIAITFALLVGAGLLLRSFAHLRSADIGVNPHNVVTAFINLPETKYKGLGERRQFFDRLLQRVRATPGVEYAAVSTEIPLQGGSNGYIHVDGVTNPTLSTQLVGWNYITTDYFRTLGIPLLSGRKFIPEDFERTAVSTQKLFDMYKAAISGGGQMKTPAGVAFVAVISEKMAQTFWRNRNPVGRSFRWNDVKVTVIGVVGDVKEYGIRALPMPQAYFPLPLALPDSGAGQLTVKTGIASAGMLGTIRSEVRALDSSLALFRPQTMDEVMAGDTQDMSVQAFLLGAFATVALALAAVGLYGITSYLVTQRTREIGIRMALGARQSSVLGLIMKQGTRLTLIGMLLGAVAAFGLTRSISRLLYGVSAADPVTFVSVAALLTVVALASYYIPARRAARVDPLRALRYG